MNIFKQPMIGPFVERNGLTGGANTGAAVTWTSAGDVYRLDVIRMPGYYIWHDSLGFAQTPNLSFEDFLLHCFEWNKRLPEFLNELAPFFRPSNGAPTPAEAGQWLNSELVRQGFSLGIAKVRNGNVVRAPVIWVFGGEADKYGSRTKYARIDFIDWTPSETKLLRRYDCWGTGARALRRLFHRSVDSLIGPMLTEAGINRFKQLLSFSRPKTTSTKLIPLTCSQKASTLRLRQTLHNLPSPFPSDLNAMLAEMPDKAYTGLLRSCAIRDLPVAARTLLLHRPLPRIGRDKLVGRFIDAQWLLVWDVCAKEAFADVNQSRFGCSELLHRVIKTGSVTLLEVVLNSLSSITSPVTQYLLERAFEQNREDMLRIILSAQVVQPVKNECLMACFRDCLFEHRDSQRLALYLLDLGVRPIQAIQPKEIIQPVHWLVENYNLPVLKKAIELESPTEENLLKLLDNRHIRPGVSFDFLCCVSREVPLHNERMGRVAFNAVVAFIYCGEKELLALLDESLREGAQLTDTRSVNVAEEPIIAGYKKKDREGNWIDLIGHLTKSGHRDEAEFVKRLGRRGSKKPEGERSARKTS